MNNAHKLGKTYYDIIFQSFRNASPFVRGHPHRKRKNAGIPAFCCSRRISVLQKGTDELLFLGRRGQTLLLRPEPQLDLHVSIRGDALDQLFHGIVEGAEFLQEHLLCEHFQGISS